MVCSRTSTQLQELNLYKCVGMKELFETHGINNSNSCCEEGSGGIPRLNNVIMLPNLKILKIEYCDHLEHIFTFNALESLTQLKELTINCCYRMQVIVKKEEDASSSSLKEVVVFLRLKSITLVDLPKLVGFFLGMNEFQWPLLDDVTIKYCPPNDGKHSLGECGLNLHVPTTAHHQCQDFRRWQKKMHFWLTTLKVVYVLSTPKPEKVEDASLEQIRRRIKWENDNYICLDHILNDFKHHLKNRKEEISLIQLGSHLKIEEGLRDQENDKGTGKGASGSGKDAGGGSGSHDQSATKGG
ncbi:unnamed protein product [Lactuca saligna]|uniref:Disease resistance protein At4g27190-like leucine-rich repeats domain-containing protein n=1 Tax=Lactuca saligna TaxID=75948 RepID=A0AA35VV55_LACSI|nr:unnamed protein product [Lactuca saligna]